MRLFPIMTIIMAAVTINCAAAKPAEEEPDALDLSIAENLERPAVPSKAKVYVRTAMDQLRRSLIKQGYTVQAIRDGEVLEVTIPCDKLFAACSTELKPSGADLLHGLGTLAAERSKYKLLIAAHTDDTGDEVYADSITAARANAVDDMLWQLSGQQDTNTVPYGLGRDEPLTSNTSRADREANRRIEVYIVPDRGLLEMAGVRRK